jgi:hypothetical protein
MGASSGMVGTLASDDVVTAGNLIGSWKKKMMTTKTKLEEHICGR